MKRKNLIIAALALLMTIPAGAQKKNVMDVEDREPVIFPESFNVDTQKMFEGWYLKNYTATDDRYATEKNPVTSDDVIKARLQAMPCFIEMPFNSTVRTFIDRYMEKDRKSVAMLLGLSIYYMPIFEQALEKEGLPLELKYLPVIESALNPNVTSKSGAAGLWQFMLETAKGLGMEVNDLVDERRDPYISSAMAASYLKQLYNQYNNWSLAIAAYNCGPGTVNKALTRAGGNAKDHDFWTIYDQLPQQTRNYFPGFIAANYVMTYYPEHNISPVLRTKPLITDTVGVNQRVSFNNISEVLNIPIEELQILNPQYRKNIIPGTAQKTYMLTLPSQQVNAYIMSEDKILELALAENNATHRETATPGPLNTDDLPAVEISEEITEAVAEQALETPEPVAEVVTVKEEPQPRQTSTGNTAGNQAKVTEKKSVNTIKVDHKVAAGENLDAIAKIYNVSADDIRSINTMRRPEPRTGQHLTVICANDIKLPANAKVVGNNNAATAQTKTEPEKETKSTQPAETATTTTKPESTRSRHRKQDNASTTTTTKTETKTETKPATKTESKTATKTDSKSTGKTDNKTATKTETKPVTKTDSKATGKTDNKTATKTDNKGNSKTDNKDNSKTDSKANGKTNNADKADKKDTKSGKKTGKNNTETNAAANGKNNGKNSGKNNADNDAKANGKNNGKNSGKNNGKNNADNDANANSKANGKKGAKNKKAEPKEEAPKDVKHTVKSGDSLSKLADKYGTTVDEIKKANGLKSDVIVDGKELTIPTKANGKKGGKNNADNDANTNTKANSKKGGKNNADNDANNNKANGKKGGKNNADNDANTNKGKGKKGGKKAAEAKPEPPKDVKHTVKPGENLTTIAKKHGVTVDELKKANNLKDDMIRDGKDLKIPTKKSSGKKK